MPLDFARYRSLVHTDAYLAESVLSTADPELAIPACPDWPLNELRDHMAGTLAFWIHQLRRADADAEGPDFTPEVRARYRLPLSTLADELVEVLMNLSADTPCWNWSSAANRADWAARRMANEIAMHRVDMQSALGIEAITPIDDDLAIDGIDEIFTTFAGAETGASLMGPDLRINAPSYVRTVRIHPELGVQPIETSAPNDTLSGNASDILQFLWNRPNRAEVHGDGEAVAAWRALPIFT